MSNLAVRTLLTSYIDLINSATNNEEKRSTIHLFFPIAACVSIPCHFGREIDDLRSISLFGETRRAFDEEFPRYRIEQGFWRATKKKKKKKDKRGKGTSSRDCSVSLQPRRFSRWRSETWPEINRS